MPLEYTLVGGRPRIASDLLRRNWLAKAERFRFALYRHDLALKAGFNPEQPRDERGRWSDVGGGSAAHGNSTQQVLSDVSPDNLWVPGARYAQNDTSPKDGNPKPLRITIYPRGTGDNSGPPLDPNPPEPPPVIPRDDPMDRKARNQVIKSVAWWAVRTALRIPAGPVGIATLVVDAASWFHEYGYPYVQSYQDPPKSLRELQDAVSSPTRGYDIHHIVEQGSAEYDGFSRELIDHPENLIRIPTIKHWQVSGWFQLRDERFDGLSPRQHLRGRAWDERRKIGLDALVRFGVLQP